MGALILGMIVMGMFFLMVRNFSLFLGIIGCLLGLGLAWAVGWGVLLAIISGMGA